MLLYAFSSLFGLAIVGTAFAMAARAALGRGRLAGLIACWIVSAGCVTALMVWRVHQQQTLLGLTPDQNDAQSVWWWILSMHLLAFASVSLRVWRRRETTATSTIRSALSNLPAYFGAIFLFFLVFAIIDASALFF